MVQNFTTLDNIKWQFHLSSLNLIISRFHYYNAKFFCSILASFKFQKFWYLNTKAMAIDKRVNIAVTQVEGRQERSMYWMSVVLNECQLYWNGGSLRL